MIEWLSVHRYNLRDQGGENHPRRFVPCHALTNVQKTSTTPRKNHVHGYAPAPNTDSYMFIYYYNHPSGISKLNKDLRKSSFVIDTEYFYFRIFKEVFPKRPICKNIKLCMYFLSKWKTQSSQPPMGATTRLTTSCAYETVNAKIKKCSVTTGTITWDTYSITIHRLSNNWCCNNFPPTNHFNQSTFSTCKVK